jgi:hypothetical protein
MLRIAAAAGALSLLATASFGAALTTFTDRASFEAALSSFAVEDFNGVAGQPSILNSPLSVGDLVLEVTGTSQGGGRNAIDAPPVQFGDIDGTTLVNLALFDPGATLTITVGFAVTALGFDEGGLNQGVVQAGAAGMTALIPSDPSFFGIVSDTPFTEFTLVDPSGGEGFRIDNVTYGSVNPIPLPAPALMLLSAIGGLTVLRRARRA